MTVQELKTFFYKGQAEKFAWPGGYPLFYITSDGAALCPSCVTEERAQIFRSTHEHSRDGWAVEAAHINYEDSALYCDHCNGRIESAYAEDEANQPN
jgi:hypothetical protein